MLCLPQNLALLLLGRIPPTQAGTGNQTGSGGAAPQTGGGGNAAPAQGGLPPGSPPAPVPAPPGIIQPQEFYTLDEHNPDRRFTGVQVREAITRAGQYDTLQSEFHRQGNELTNERQARVTAEQQLSEIQEQERLANYMQGMGYGSQAQPGSPQAQLPNQSQPQTQQQPAQQAGVQSGADAGDDWLANYGFQPSGQPEGPGAAPGQGAPNQQPGSQGTVPQANSAPSMNDPRQLSLMMKAIIDDSLSKTLTPMQQQLPQLVNAAVNQRFTQQAQRDNVRDSFRAGREQLSTDLNQKWGVDPTRSKDIIDKMSLSQANYEEASTLLKASYADDNQRAQASQLADQKIAQGNMFFNSAVQDGIQAAQEGQSTRYQQEAQQQLMSGDYVDMGDMAEPNRNVWDPRSVDQQNTANLQKAMEIAETQGRLQAVAGPTGPAVPPSGFIQPGMIQPGQPSGYVPPTHGAQPPPVATGQPVQQPGWGAFQQQGYGNVA